MGSLRSIRRESKEITEAEHQFRKFLIELAEYGILTLEAQDYWGVRRDKNGKDDEK
jgi:hypothetical protein